MQSAAIGIIFDDKGRLLLVKRKDLPLWVPPGGGIDPGESPEAAVLREIKEECGVEACIIRKVGLWLPVNRLGAPSHIFFCRLKKPDSKLPECSQESSAIAFFDRDKLPPLFFLHKEWIEAALCENGYVERRMTNLNYLSAIWIFIRHPYLSLRYLLARLGVPINR